MAAPCIFMKFHVFSVRGTGGTQRFFLWNLMIFQVFSMRVRPRSHFEQIFQKSPLWGSNPRPYAYEAHALPTELRRHIRNQSRITRYPSKCCIWALPSQFERTLDSLRSVCDTRQTCNAHAVVMPIIKKIVYTSRFVRVILAQGPC